MVSRTSKYPFWTPSGQSLLTYIQMMLLLCLLQQHILATHILTNATLEVVRNKQHIVWHSVAHSNNIRKCERCDVPIEGMDSGK